jgi:hypothetical protein
MRREVRLVDAVAEETSGGGFLPFDPGLGVAGKHATPPTTHLATRDAKELCRLTLGRIIGDVAVQSPLARKTTR